MKLILINDSTGGDSQIQIFEMNSIQLEKELPEIGFFTYKDTQIFLSGEVQAVSIHSLHRKRNVMKYITKLFRRKKRGNTNT